MSVVNIATMVLLEKEMLTSDAIAMPIVTHFFSERIYHSSVFFDHDGYLVKWPLSFHIKHTKQKIQKLTSYNFPPTTSGCLLEVGTSHKIVKKQAIFQVQ